MLRFIKCHVPLICTSSMLLLFVKLWAAVLLVKRFFGGTVVSSSVSSPLNKCLALTWSAEVSSSALSLAWAEAKAAARSEYSFRTAGGADVTVWLGMPNWKIFKPSTKNTAKSTNGRLREPVAGLVGSIGLADLRVIRLEPVKLLEILRGEQVRRAARESLVVGGLVGTCAPLFKSRFSASKLVTRSLSCSFSFLSCSLLSESSLRFSSRLVTYSFLRLRLRQADSRFFIIRLCFFSTVISILRFGVGTGLRYLKKYLY